MAEQKQNYSNQENSKIKVLITGANKGIGLALARLLVEDKNMQIIIGCRNLNLKLTLDKDKKLRKDPVKWELEDEKNDGMTRLELLKKKFINHNNVDFLEINLNDLEQIEKSKKIFEEKYGNLNILVNNAGMAWHDPNLFNREVVDKTFDVNYFGTKRVTEAFLNIMKPYENDQQLPKIINVCSFTGILKKRVTDPIEQKIIIESYKDETLNSIEKILENFKKATSDEKVNEKYSSSAYGTSKAFEIAYSRWLAEKQKQKMYVCHICPGWVQTYMSNNGGYRQPVHGAKGIQLLCQTDYKQLLNYGSRFFNCAYDNNNKPDLKTAKLVSVDFLTGQQM